ncbi:MAG TPA: RNA degradosome polyphosphate kinase, partial [Solimonas sp.]
LEHHRVFSFHNDGADEVWLSSADWMERNLFRRVEVAFPVEDKKIRARILEDLNGYLADTAQTWILQADGNYLRPEKIEGKAVQQKFMDET